MRSTLRSVRRQLILSLGHVALGLGLATLGASSAWAENAVVRIGYQKYGTLTILKGKGDLEKRLAPLGVSVKWVEFPAGPQLLEGLNVGSIDFGNVGEAPPIFAQAAGADLVGKLNATQFLRRRISAVIELDLHDVGEARHRPIGAIRAFRREMNGILAPQPREVGPPGIVAIEARVAEIDIEAARVRH